MLVVVWFLVKLSGWGYIMHRLVQDSNAATRVCAKTIELLISLVIEFACFRHVVFSSDSR